MASVRNYRLPHPRFHSMVHIRKSSFPKRLNGDTIYNKFLFLFVGCFCMNSKMYTLLKNCQVELFFIFLLLSDLEIYIYILIFKQSYIERIHILLKQFHVLFFCFTKIYLFCYQNYSNALL